MIPRQDKKRLSLGSIILILLMFVIPVAYWLSTSSQPIIDRHVFRQAQTAISVKYLFEDGVSVFNYQTPVLGKPWSIPFEFPTYQVIVKIISSMTGWNLVQVGRLTNSVLTLLSVITCLLILWAIRVKEIYIIMFSALVATSSIYLYWGRSFLIEMTALLFTALAALFYLNLRFELRSSFKVVFGKNIIVGLFKFLLFTIFLALGMLTKATTTLPLIGFVAIDQIYIAIVLMRTEKHLLVAVRSGLIFASISFFATALTRLWIRHADALKELNANAEFILSKNLTLWNFGSLSDRLELSRWLDVFTGEQELNIRLIIPISIFALFLGSNALILINRSIVAQKSAYIANFGYFMYICGPLVFFNLYYVHEYYSSANLLFGYLSLVASSNVIDCCVKERLGGNQFRIFSVILVTFVCVMQLNWFNEHYKRSSFKKTNDALVISEYVKSNSLPGDRLITVGEDWSSQLFFLSGRKGLAIRSMSPQSIQSSENEIKKMIDNNSSSVFLIEKTSSAGQAQASYWPVSNYLKCAVAHQVGKYKAYKCVINKSDQ